MTFPKTPFAATVALLLLAGCGSSSSTPAVAASTCTDGVRNGSETGVDCGGSCSATCALGVSCGAAGDCLFGTCQAGACAAPATGPAPTGPVTATIPPTGGTLTAVTAEHVSVTLEFPAGPGGVSLRSNGVHGAARDRPI